MAYEIRRGEEPAAAVRRIARGEVDRARAEAADPKLDTHEAVHEVRKRCKKVRAVLRLVRSAIGGLYATENARFRDASRILSELRDAQVHLEAVQALSAEGRLSALQARALIAVFVARRDRVVAGPPGVREQLARFERELAVARPAIDRWCVEADRSIWAAGLTRCYRRCRSRMRRASEERSDENLHEWRKRIKDHGYQLRLVARLAGSAHARHAEQVHRLAEHLGRDHDLAGLRLLLQRDPELLQLEASAEMVGLIEAEREAMQREAFSLARSCLSLEPKELARRLELA